MLPLASGVNTIMGPLLQPVCTDRNARLVSVTSKIEAHGATSMSGERHVPLDACKDTPNTLPRFTLQFTFSVGIDMWRNPLGTQSPQSDGRLDIQPREASLRGRHDPGNCYLIPGTPRQH